MHIAEKLYQSGYISYPRTESTKYANSFNFQEIVNNLQKYDDSEIAAYSSKLVLVKSHKGEDHGDHPPITPTVKIPHSLSGDEKRMYGYIVRHFLGSISKDAKFLSTKI